MRSRRIKSYCLFCPRTYASKYILKYHVEKDHAGIRYKCSECQILFTRNSECKTHLQICHLSIYNATAEKIKIDLTNQIHKESTEVYDEKEDIHPPTKKIQLKKLSGEQIKKPREKPRQYL